MLPPLGDPRVLHYLNYGDSFVLILFKHLSYKVLSMTRDSSYAPLAATRATRISVIIGQFIAFLSLAANLGELLLAGAPAQPDLGRMQKLNWLPHDIHDGLFLVGGDEGHSSCERGIKHDTCRPNVRRLIVWPIEHDLRRAISEGARRPLAKLIWGEEF